MRFILTFNKKIIMETKITKKGKNEDYWAKKKEFAQKAT